MISKIIVSLLALALIVVTGLCVWISYDMFFVAKGAELMDKLVAPIIAIASVFGLVKLWPHIGLTTNGKFE